ncbi:MAG: hypothetical protein IPM39_29415 [Chloroflexi bacterium]|nr:hypothetical protein [Chloroflexota bacterium]
MVADLPDYALGRMAVAVLRVAAFDARRGKKQAIAFFNSEDYLFWVDVVNAFWGTNLDASASPIRRQTIGVIGSGRQQKKGTAVL